MLAHSRIDWGNATELLAAILSLLTIITALVITRSERTESRKNIEVERALTREALAQAAQSHELEVQRWRTESEERDKWQAKLVTLRVSRRVTGDDNAGKGFFEFEVWNSSTTVVFDVRGFVRFQGVAFRGPVTGQSILPRPASVSIELLVPSDNALGVPPHNCGVTFRDSAGQYWARYDSGHLIHLSGDHEQMLALEPF